MGTYHLGWALEDKSHWLQPRSPCRASVCARSSLMSRRFCLLVAERKGVEGLGEGGVGIMFRFARSKHLSAWSDVLGVKSKQHGTLSSLQAASPGTAFQAAQSAEQWHFFSKTTDMAQALIRVFPALSSQLGEAIQHSHEYPISHGMSN